MEHEIRMSEHDECRAVLGLIYSWAGLHTDDTASLDNKCPEDLTAHMNGLIRQECARVLGWPKPRRHYLKRADDEDVAGLIERLRRYNDWRRGAEVNQPSPASIGADIDAAIALLRRYYFR